MDVSMQLRDLANSVGEDFAMNAPDDTARLVGKARRGRMVWSTGVGAAVVGSAASLAFGGPALASVLTSGPAVAPAGSTTPSASVTPSAAASVTPSPSTSPSATPSTTPLPGAGGSLGGVPGGVGGDDDATENESHESGDSHESSDSIKTGGEHSGEHESEGSDD